VTQVRSNQTRLRRAILIGALVATQATTATLRAVDTNTPAQALPTASVVDTNTLELIKQLQRRIEELEQKVKGLERGKTPAEAPEGAKEQQHLEALDQKVKALERENELAQETNAARVKSAPRISLGADGFSFASANGDYAIQLHGILQMDSRTFFDEPSVVGNDSLLIRRARPILQGTVFRSFDFLFVPDFAPSSGPQLFDAYVNYTYSPALQFRAGKYKAPLGLEQLMEDRDMLLNERSLATDLVPNRDVGFELHGDLFDGRVSYAAGIFNGTTDGGNSGNTDFADARAFIGRLFFEPFKKASTDVLRGIGFGVAGSYETMSNTNTAGLPSTTGGSLPGYFTDGQQQFFAYNPADKAVVVAEDDHWRLSPQAYYYYGPFGLLGEYVISDQKVARTAVAPFDSAHLRNTAWEISASWVLTGEDAAYAGGVVPRRSFDPRDGGWGAWQLVGRYAELNIDRAAFPEFADPQASAGSAGAWSVGLNWYMNRNVRVNASYSHTHFNGGGGSGTSAPAAVTRRDENVMFTRVQLAF
jgi:phosphate-selective porin OprO/OprP